MTQTVRAVPLGKGFYMPFQPMPKQQEPEPRLPPFRYPDWYDQIIDMRGPNNNAGSQTVRTVPVGKELWLTTATLGCLSGAAATHVVVNIIDEAGVILQNLASVYPPANQHQALSLSFPWPLYLREGYAIQKDVWVGAPTSAYVAITGWEGPIPQSRYIHTYW